MLRLPAPLRPLQRPRNCCATCTAKVKDCCFAVGAHSWFLTICCGYVLVSSLPRILCFLDVVITIALFFSNHQSPNHIDTLESEFLHFKFEVSTVDVVFISIIRSIILFLCFAYRYQREGYRKNIYVACAIVIACTIYLIIKYSVLKNEKNVVMFSLFMAYIECGMFFLVRRRRIRFRPPLESRSRRTSQYYRIDEETTTHLASKTKTSTNSSHHHHVLAIADEDYLDTIDDRDDSISEDIDVRPHQSIANPRSMYGSIPDAEFQRHELPLRTPSSEFFIIDSIPVHYRMEKGTSSDPDAPFVVLLHGFGGGVFSWRRSWSLLKKHVSGILAFDRPGFGLTEIPRNQADSMTTKSPSTVLDDGDGKEMDSVAPSGRETALIDADSSGPSGTSSTTSEGVSPYSIDFTLHIIRTLMDKFQVGKAILIGHANGGAASCWMAHDFPDYVEGLVLISPSKSMPKFIRSILKTKLGKPIILQLVRSELGQVTLHQAWHNPHAIPHEVTDSYRAALKMKHWDEALLEMARVVPRERFGEALRDITCPVYIFHGDDDKLVSFRESEMLNNCFRHSTLMKLSECGHIPHEEIPERFVQNVASVIKDFRDGDEERERGTTAANMARRRSSSLSSDKRDHEHEAFLLTE